MSLNTLIMLYYSLNLIWETANEDADIYRYVLLEYDYSIRVYMTALLEYIDLYIPKMR